MADCFSRTSGVLAIYGNNHTQIYYNIDKSLPSTLASNVANDKLKEDFDMSTVHMVLLKKGLDSEQTRHRCLTRSIKLTV